MIDIILPQNVEHIISELEKNGYEAYIVGGCVRDSLMNRNPNDWDITTNAKPEQTMACFEKTIPTGIKHGTITVMIDKEPYEVTTYRIDGQYKDSRRPDNVEFVEDITKDLARRDFTINAIAYNPKRGFVDPFDGIKHIYEKLVTTVGDADTRFTEDNLRIIRAVRFEHQLKFNMSKETYESIKRNKNLIKNVAKERIQQEFNKMLLSNDGYFLYRLEELDLLDKIIPEAKEFKNVVQNNPHHRYNVFEHTVEAVNNIENELHLKLSALFHDIGKAQAKTTDKNNIDHFYNHPQKSFNIARKVLNELRYDKKTIDIVTKLILYHDRPVDTTKKAVKKMINLLGSYEMFKDWISLRFADILAQNPKYSRSKLEKLVKIELIAQEIIDLGEPFTLKELVVNGNDIMKLGYKGNEVGKILERLLEIVIEDERLNNREYLISQIE